MQVNELLKTFNNSMKLAQQKNQSNTKASNRLVYVQLLNCHYMLRQVEGDVLKPDSTHDVWRNRSTQQSAVEAEVVWESGVWDLHW